ncbi:phosphoribosyltransferase [Thetidibacter halocola]|uniref:Phosphoribosyltransferase n=1 Tax=Thetidibacter halocola TaxID=2827239 RepID=A0A8J7W8M9_9RHOB|nr:phosphoribosyltransferase family protein [Thetidibacter halocola]MBS0122932.1 phosphoribosyltransferase [Thetidibacter halocola]
MTLFADRAEAGRALAARLAALAHADPVILALPRGGVPLGIEVARRLHAPMDLLMVRKIGAPGQKELAVGAVVDGDAPQYATNPEVMRAFGLSRADVERLALPELAEIHRRRALYSGGRAPVPIAGRTAIVVDDGIATGATTRAALRALRRRDPARIVLAVPVAPRDTLDSLRGEVDQIVCLHTPEPFHAVGLHYRDFPQTGDDEVVRLMDEAARIAGPECGTAPGD